jgi:hypothetical protein
MRMQMSAVSDYASLSDSDLDSSYQNAWDTMQTATGADKVTWAQVVSDIASNIISRVGGFWGFITGAANYTRFPKYDAIQKAGGGGFQQAATAQSSIAQSASNVAQTATSALKWGLGGAMGLGVAVLVALYLLKKK